MSQATHYEAIDVRRALRAWVPALGLAAALGLAVPSFMLFVRISGWQIPQKALELDYLMGVVWAIVLTCCICLWPIPSRDKLVVLTLWILKCLVALGFMLLYEGRYSLDAFGYFARYVFPTPPWGQLGLGLEGGNAVIELVAWYQARLMPPSYHGVKVTFALIGLMGIYAFYRGAVILLGRSEPRLLLLMGLYPSILFWSSILGKDPVMLLGVALHVYGVIGWNQRRNIAYAIPMAVGLLLAMMVRLWMGPILLLPLSYLVLRSLRHPASRVAFVVIALLAGRTMIGAFAADFRLSALADVYALAGRLSTGWEGGSGQSVQVQFTGPGDILAFIPHGAFTALFRPLPGEVNNPFGAVAGLENLALLVLTGLGVWRARRDRLREPLLHWAIMVIVCWAAVYGFVSSQNLGAAARFKLQILPLLLGVLYYLTRKPEATPDRIEV